MVAGVPRQIPSSWKEFDCNSKLSDCTHHIAMNRSSFLNWFEHIKQKKSPLVCILKNSIMHGGQIADVLTCVMKPTEKPVKFWETK